MITNKTVYISTENNPVISFECGRRETMLDVLTTVINRYGADVIGVFDKPEEAFQAYLITKELNNEYKFNI